jgi:DNA-binding CsgD family transcriptional regulator
LGRPAALGEAFLAAAVEPQRWLDALEQLAFAAASDHAQIIGIGPELTIGFNWVSDMGPEAHAAADRADLISPATNFRVAAALTTPPDSIVAEDRYAAIKPHLTDDAYLDLCSDLQIPHGCQTTLLSGETGLVGFALLRSERTGPSGSDTRDLFARVRESAAVAAGLQVALEREGHQLIAGSFEAMGTACFVLDRRMTVRAATSAAEGLLHEGAIRLADMRLALDHPADDKRLAAAIASVAAEKVMAASVTISDSAGLLMLKLYRLPAREWNMGFAPYAILIAKRPNAANAVDHRFLRDAYGLTATEAEVALLLRSGLARDAICTARGITRETLRSHLRSLFAKLGVARETEAIHLLHALLS